MQSGWYYRGETCLQGWGFFTLPFSQSLFGLGWRWGGGSIEKTEVIVTVLTAGSDNSMRPLERMRETQYNEIRMDKGTFRKTE